MLRHTLAILSLSVMVEKRLLAVESRAAAKKFPTAIDSAKKIGEANFAVRFARKPVTQWRLTQPGKSLVRVWRGQFVRAVSPALIPSRANAADSADKLSAPHLHKS
jgi:hypothetical protein